MKMSTAALFLLFLIFPSLVHAQRQIAFISIDCGAPSKLYEDPDTSITYSPDDNFIDTGISQNISSIYMYPNNPNLPLPLSDLKSFPQGNKNCYTLKPEAGKGSLNLIRASFLYGNYDGQNKLPEFDLYVDVNFWSSVKFKNASDIVTKEILAFAQSDVIHICLVNKGMGTPFISALELRPLNGSTYVTEFGTNSSLVLFQRLDIGSINGTGRYVDDVSDRVWSNYVSPSWDSVSTSAPIVTYEDGYRVPYEVIQTAARPRNGTELLELQWNTTDLNSKFYVYMYFSEVEHLQKNQSRKMNISWNGTPLFGQFIPRYLYADILSNSKALVGKDHRISIYKAENSTLLPILNAVEIYQVMQLVQSPTYSEDVDAIMNVKKTYHIKKTWAGDPCAPKNFSWEGLKCNYTVSAPRIISLNLTSSKLNGIIAASISRLSSLESLDLSNNNLTGSVPEFLEELKSLKTLNLKGNQLSGFVPNDLVERSEAGLLELSVDSQNICGSDSCKRNKKTVAPIVGSVLSALVVLIVLLLVWKLKTKKKTAIEGGEAIKKGVPVASKKCQFTYDEVVEITKGFETEIGKGGFGVVYHGYMKDGTQVAVKMLSPSSNQGPREFQTEAELLMRIHHRNLASFIGYCDDADNLALIYEYMANGNLKAYLSDKNSCMTWSLRLHIAIDAAQGLEYLHHGCKPPIVHRDVKTANILLSENMDAKIADFGLSKVFSNEYEVVEESTIMGTAGYLDPEYYNSHKLNEKSDVYSFGVVLLELITGQPAVIRSDESIHILEWVSPELQKGDIESVVDRRMQGDFDANSVWKAFEIAMKCTYRASQQRATMDVVLSELKQCLEMELSRNREGYSGLIVESGERFAAAYSSSPYNSSMYTDSTNTDSMTEPYAR